MFRHPLASSFVLASGSFVSMLLHCPSGDESALGIGLAYGSNTREGQGLPICEEGGPAASLPPTFFDGSMVSIVRAPAEHSDLIAIHDQPAGL